MADQTGERLLPDQQRGELVHAEHLARYRFAAQFAPGTRALDAATGEGYGAAILANAGAAEVVGVDIDTETVVAARAKYGLDFQVADVTRLPFPDASFDLVVSFETIEHVSDGSLIVSELRRVLRPGGVLVASTPNSTRYRADNEFHEREFTGEEFEDLLRPHFSAIRLYYQQDWLTSAVLDEDQFASEDERRSLDLDLAKVASHRPGEQLFTIAVCGDSPSTGAQTAVITGVFEAHEMLQWVERALHAERLLAVARTERDSWMERSREAERQLSQTRERVATMEQSASWRVTAPLRAAAGRARRAR